MENLMMEDVVVELANNFEYEADEDEMIWNETLDRDDATWWDEIRREDDEFLQFMMAWGLEEESTYNTDINIETYSDVYRHGPAAMVRDVVER